MIKSIYLAAVMLICFLLSSAVCIAGTDYKLIAEPGKPSCRKQHIQINTELLQGELCVLQGMFAHDKYQFSIGGVKIISGIDDETTKGIAGYFKNEYLLLRCTPQLEVPDKADPGMVQYIKKTLPDISEEDAEKVAIKMKTVEVGRHCTVRHKDSDIFNVIIEFK